MRPDSVNLLYQISKFEWSVVSVDLRVHKKDMFKKDWTTCSRIVNYYRL